MYGCLNQVILILLSLPLLTFAIAGPVRPADKRHLSEEKVSWYFNKTFLKSDNHAILVIIIKYGTDSNITGVNN